MPPWCDSGCTVCHPLSTDALLMDCSSHSMEPEALCTAPGLSDSCDCLGAEIQEVSLRHRPEPEPRCRQRHLEGTCLPSPGGPSLCRDLCADLSARPPTELPTTWHVNVSEFPVSFKVPVAVPFAPPIAACRAVCRFPTPFQSAHSSSAPLCSRTPLRPADCPRHRSPSAPAKATSRCAAVCTWTHVA